MKKRDIGILIGLGVVVILVAWYFLIIIPKKDETDSKLAEYQKANTEYEQNRAKVQRIDEERTAAKQAAGDLLKLNKLIPMDSQVPSMIVELQSTANEAGLKFLKIVPGTAVAGSDGGTIVPIEINVQGEYFDVHDFLYRVENYARMEGNDINVTGRLINVITLEMMQPDIGNFPEVLVKIGANAYMTDPAPAGKTASRTQSNPDATQ
ncbi:MAG: type IV pilus inner membrane component PilO [Thermoleophilia bacterium]